MIDPLKPLKKVAVKIGATPAAILPGQATPMGAPFGIDGIDPEEIGLTDSEDAFYYRGRAIDTSWRETTEVKFLVQQQTPNYTGF